MTPRRPPDPPTPPRTDAPDALADRAADARWRAAVWAVVAAGAALRVGVWLQAYPLWHDEAATAANFLGRSFGDFPRPLDDGQVAPLGFIWAEVAAVRLFGFGERALRFVPLLCGVAGLAVFGRLCLSALRGPAAALAVAFVAAGSYPVRHAAEVKPYAGDFLATSVLVYLAWRAHRRPTTGRLVALAAAGPVALFVSFPAVFVAGGCLLAVAPAVLRRGGWGARAAWVVANLLVAGTFAGLLAVTVQAQHQTHAVAMTAHWGDAFPPRDGVLPLVRWVVEAATGVTFAYPLGGRNSASFLTTLFVAVGVAAFWRDGRTWLPACAAGVTGLALAAAALHRYPFGGHPRVMLYLGPFVCLLAGTGLAAVLRWRPDRGLSERWRVGLAFGAFAAVGLGLAARSAVKPYAMVEDERARAFARWFWQDRLGTTPTVQATDRLAAEYPAVPFHLQPQFRCHRAMFATAPTAPLTDRVPARLDGEACFVVHLLDPTPAREAVVNLWREETGRAHRLARADRFDVNPGRGIHHGVYFILWYAPAAK